MGLVYHNIYVLVLVLELHNLGELGQVSFHGEHAVHHDEFHALGRAAAQAALQVLHVVVLVVKALGEGQAAAVYDGSVVTVITDDEIVLGEKLRDNAAVHGEAGGEHQGLVLTHELCELLFQLDVNVQGAVQETGAGATRAVFLERLDTGVDDALVTGKTCICVGTKHHNLVTVHGHLGSLFACNLAEIRINTLFHHFLRKVIFGQPRM